MTRPRAGALAVLLLAGCGATPPPARTPVEQSAPVGELSETFPPSGGAASNRGETGTYSRVVLGSRRERVTDLVRTFLRALIARDLEGVRALLDDNVANVDGSDIAPPESVVRRFAEVLAEDEVSALNGALDHADSHVYSRAMWSRTDNFVPATMAPTDWWVDLSGRDVPSSALPHWPVQGMLVRFVGDAPRITAVRWNLSRAR